MNRILPYLSDYSGGCICCGEGPVNAQDLCANCFGGDAVQVAIDQAGSGLFIGDKLTALKWLDDARRLLVRQLREEARP